MSIRRPVCWTERLEDGVKREVRVNFIGGDKVRWQVKRSDEEKWTYDPVLPDADWDELLANMERRYVRRNVPWKHLELIRRLHAKHRTPPV
jgi:hypothetical protein